MNKRYFISMLLALVLGLGWSLAQAGNLPENPTFTTLVTTPLVIEGLTGDTAGNLYTPERNAGTGVSCPVRRVNLAAPALVTVGFIPAPSAASECSPSGIAFNDAGDLFVADGSRILTFTPNAAAPPTAVVYATGVPGTNGVAFDRDGNLWTADGTTGQGRVWRIGPGGGNCTPATLFNCVEVFRVQPMANEVNLVAGVGGVGRDVRTLPPGTITVTSTSRNAANTAGSQPLVANGLAFNQAGDLFIADTARGAIWRAQFKDGNLTNETNCDTTFTPNTLCLDSVFVAHPYLEGADGMVLDTDENIWVSANERNAIVLAARRRPRLHIGRSGGAVRHVSEQ